MPREQLLSEPDLTAAIQKLADDLKRVPTNREVARYLTQKMNRIIRPHYINKKKVEFGLTTPQLSHKDLIHETLLPEDMKSMEAQYFRVLNALKQREMRPMVSVKKSINWARRHVKEGEDVRYNREGPEDERWEYFKADPANWRLRTVLEDAKAGLKELLAE